MAILVREALSSDIEALVGCHSEFMEHHIAVDRRFSLKLGAKEKWSKQITESIDDLDTLVLVAIVDNMVVGCAYTIIKKGAMDFGPEKIGYLCDVYVDPEYRRQGIARQFLSASQRWLKERRINIIEASWSVNCEEAQNTWPALGFIPISISAQMQF